MKPYATLGIRNRTLLTSWGLCDSYRHPIAGTECVIEKNMEVGEGFAVRTCHNIEDRKRLRPLIEKEIRAGKYTRGFFDATDKTYKDTAKDIKSFWKKDLSAASNQELIEYFDRFYQIYITTLHPMVLAIYVSDLQDVFEAELRKAVGNVSQEQMLEYTALLLTPTRLTTVQKEEQLLFDLQDTFENVYAAKTRAEFETFIETPESKKILTQLENEYGWFHMEYIGEPKVAADYAALLLERIEDVKKDGSAWKDQLSPNARVRDIVQRQKEFFTAHSDSTFFKDLAFAMQEFLIVLDYSKADLVEGIYYARPLLDEVGKRVGLGDWISVRFLLPDELKDLLRNDRTIEPAFIEDRKKRFALVLEDMKITPYFGDAATEVAEKLLERDEPGAVKEFKGLTAFPGNVRGIACIVTGAQDRNKFKKGQIMVTRDTTTELTSIIKMASAIIADQGSLLSHTAIVSREFKIPCLVQTKFGTKVVQDGDEIEVDASNGVVRILS